MDDNALASQLAERAGHVLVRIQQNASAAEIGTSELKHRGDRESQGFLANALAEHRPDDAILSEEASDDLTRLTAERVWIIDPLDGTREFSEGRHDWAVHVALWECGELTAGAVALPGLNTVLTDTDAPQRWETVEKLRFAVSRTRATPLVQELAASFNGELMPMGSAGFKAAAVVRGEADVYVHTGGQYEWDSAAPVAVANAAGLFASRIDGSPLVYNGENPYLPDLIICNPIYATQLLDKVAELLREEPL